MKKNLGFTLIELLVVISIIGFLATASVVVLNNTRLKARNNKRNQDIKQLITAINLITDNAGGVIPVTADWVCVSSSCYGNTWFSYPADPAFDAAMAPYMKKPEDPANSSRGEGGYLFKNPAPDYNGYGIGAYLNWVLEPTAVVPGVCGPGFVYSAPANYIQCLAKINP